jgi:hypothetical protein
MKKNKTKIMLAMLALSASALVANAQDAGGPPPDGQRPPRQGPGGPGGMNGHRPPPSPLMEALDANHDGIIDADEIANASAALKKLDKNGDGKLTPDELRPHRPQGGGGGGGQGWGPGPDGQYPPDGQRPNAQQPPPQQNPPSDN